MTEDELGRLTRALSEWAVQEHSVTALAVVGSWARGAAEPSSDLDLMALTSDLARWAGDDQWLRELLAAAGFIATASRLEGRGVARSWRVWLGDDCELELTLAPPSWARAVPMDQGTRRVAQDGLLPLVDKDGLLRSLRAAIYR